MVNKNLFANLQGAGETNEKPIREDHRGGCLTDNRKPLAQSGFARLLDELADHRKVLHAW